MAETFNLRERRRQFLIRAGRLSDLAAEGLQESRCAPTADLARCDREIAAARTQTDQPAWIVALGIADWERERDLILAGHGDGEPLRLIL